MKALIGLLAIWLSLASAISQAAPYQSREEQLQSIKTIYAAYKAARMAAIAGPNLISVPNQARFNLPASTVFIPKNDVNHLLKAIKANPSDMVVGAILPEDESNPWAIEIRFNPFGYISEKDSAQIHSTTFMNEMKDAFIKASAQHAGIQIMFNKWVMPPAYDPTKHRLEFSFDVRSIGLQDEQFFIAGAVLLGREGGTALVMHAKYAEMAKAQAVFRQILDGWTYLPKKRYEDYNFLFDRAASIDNVNWGLEGTYDAKRDESVSENLSNMPRILLIVMIALAGIVFTVIRRLKPKD
ncbi:DUF2167 domain-containing protein [Chitinivorax sp. B]|uniref:DUF2167 domain-containing protein n=1 Tax=Chitinivorax sp. B TaxID=2502235 RepID=UPI0010F5CA74|nr:DUF2167 domain-containing protein [Chitinivorax sp. B]